MSRDEFRDYGSSQEYRFEIYAYDGDGQLLKRIDCPGGWLSLDLGQLDGECGSQVRGLRLREYLLTPQMEAERAAYARGLADGAAGSLIPEEHG